MSILVPCIANVKINKLMPRHVGRFIDNTYLKNYNLFSVTQKRKRQEKSSGESGSEEEKDAAIPTTSTSEPKAELPSSASRGESEIEN